MSSLTRFLSSQFINSYNSNKILGFCHTESLILVKHRFEKLVAHNQMVRFNGFPKDHKIIEVHENCQDYGATELKFVNRDTSVLEESLRSQLDTGELSHILGNSELPADQLDSLPFSVELHVYAAQVFSEIL